MQIKKKKMEIHRDLFEAKPAFDKLVSEGKTYLTKGNWNPPLMFFPRNLTKSLQNSYCSEYLQTVFSFTNHAFSLTFFS